MTRLAGRLVYQKIREALGVQQAVVSGGGSLQPHLDDFFEAVGITIVNGWGLSVRCRLQSTHVSTAMSNSRHVNAL